MSDVLVRKPGARRREFIQFGEIELNPGSIAVPEAEMRDVIAKLTQEVTEWTAKRALEGWLPVGDPTFASQVTGADGIAAKVTIRVYQLVER